MSVEVLVDNWLAANHRWDYQPQPLTLDLLASFAQATTLDTLRSWYYDDKLDILEFEELVALHLEKTL